GWPAIAGTASSSPRRTAPRSRSGADRLFGRAPPLPTLDFRPSSLDVLHLFAKLFQLRLQGDDLARDQTVVGLRADRVHLAVHLLRQEIESAPDRFLGLHTVVELLEMAFHPGQLLRNIRAIGEINDLLEQPFVIDARHRQPGTLDALTELFLVTLGDCR